jgi:hypothetical protein
MRPSQRAFGRAGAVLAVILAAGGASAQVTVQGRQPLDFGITLAGVNASVAPTDAVHAGLFYAVDRLHGVVQVSLALPTTLTGPSGKTLTLKFAATDGVIRTTGAGATSTTFNPKISKNVTLSTSPDFYVELGGTVQPIAKQVTGKYTGTITLTITVIS